MATSTQQPKAVNLDLEKCLDHFRISFSLRNLLLLPYFPIGSLLFITRVCMSLQLLLVLILPFGRIKRLMLRVYFAVMGLVVINRDFKNRNSEARMLVGNRVSHFDHILFQLATDCVTTSVGGRRPFLCQLFDHCVFTGERDEAIVGEAKQLPEFDDTASSPDLDSVTYATQPECTPTNGTALLKFSSWPFALEAVVQPVVLSWWRPFDVRLSTVHSSGLWDVLWTLFLPLTIVNLRMLPSMEMSAADTPQQFADSVQRHMADRMEVPTSDADAFALEEWKAANKKPSRPPTSRHNPSAAIIPESEFPHVPPGMESMVQQIAAVLPQVPYTVVRKDLMETRSVDATIANILEGRVRFEPVPTLDDSFTRPPPPSASARKEVKTTSKMKAKFSLEEGMRTFEERKKALLEQARRRYREKHDL